MRKVLVTGGAGFIGSHLCEALLRERYEVCVLDDLSAGRRAYVPRAARFVELDVRSPKVARVVAELKPDYVCHLAAQRSATHSQADPAGDASVNIVGSLNLLQACRELNLAKFLFVSTCAVFFEPRHLPAPEDAPVSPAYPYGMSKHTVERYLESFGSFYGVPWVVVRFPNVYGPRQNAASEGGVVAIFSRQLLAGEPLAITGRGEQTRDFIYVTDAAAGTVAALERGDGIFHISTASELSVRELAVQLGAAAGTVPQVRYVGARPGDVPRISLANTRAVRELGWQPRVSLADGLAATLAWFRDEG